MPLFTDATGNSVLIANKPQRIISLVPSFTETLHHLGLNEQVCGITKFCVHPQHWRKTKNIIGGTKNPAVDKIKALEPDLIIASKEENNLTDIEALKTFAPVYTFDVSNFGSALNSITTIGLLTGKEQQAAALTSGIENEFGELKKSNIFSAVYLIWNKPLMTVGGDTYISSMMEICGLNNIYQSAYRYPQTDIATLQKEAPQLLLLSSEPYPFKQLHVDYFAKQLPHTKVLLADGEMFSWYGSRMLLAPSYFKNLQAQIAGLL